MTDSPGRPAPDAPGPDGVRPADDATSPDGPAPTSPSPAPAPAPTPPASPPPTSASADEPASPGEPAAANQPAPADAPSSAANGSPSPAAPSATDQPASADQPTPPAPSASSGDASAQATPPSPATPPSLAKPPSPGEPSSAGQGPSLDKGEPKATGQTGSPAPAPGWASVQPPAAGWGPPAQGPATGWGPPQSGPDPRWGGPQQPLWNAPPGWNGPYVQAAKPGVIPLRPLSIGEILDGAFAAMRAHWKVMIGIAVVVALVTQCLEVPITWLLDQKISPSDLGDHPTGDEAWRYLRDTAAVTFVPLVVATLGQIAATAMLTVLVSRAVIAKTMSAAQTWTAVRPLLPRLLGVTFATWLIPVGTLLIALLPGLALLAVGADGLGALLLLPGIIGGVVAAIYLYVCFALAGPTLMLEKQSIRRSLERSRKLVTGSWWRVCGVLLLIALIMTIVGGIIQTPFLLASDGFSALTASKPSEVPTRSFVDLLITGVGAVISAALLYPFAAGATALLYIDQRIRREALDLELARAAGIPTQDAASGPTSA
ncbi:hypothetical protein [Embleya sp. AB8]|uniref:hypothetical protein n=1 Tax=Embleya sp. AB8 TaxID=3156304 RepID=UPI003C70D02F